jgi:hypothetical protein
VLVVAAQDLASQRTQCMTCLRSLGKALVKAKAATGFSLINAKVSGVVH